MGTLLPVPNQGKGQREKRDQADREAIWGFGHAVDTQKDERKKLGALTKISSVLALILRGAINEPPAGRENPQSRTGRWID